MRANITVAKDRSGHFTMISATNYYIAIRAGLYMENVSIGPNKQNIVLIRDGMDTTIISGKRSKATGFRTYDTATIG